MGYREFVPSEELRKYVKCYYTYESHPNVTIEDKAFATGCIEIMFNLGNGKWQTGSGKDLKTNPAIELWGQIIKPLEFKSLGGSTMFGIRFYPHTASLFLNDDINIFNDQVSDLAEIAGMPMKILHFKMMEVLTPEARIKLVEEFLLSRLSAQGKKLEKVRLIDNVLIELRQEDFFDNIENVASRYGISSRYLQKIFVQHTGLTPKLYCKINRFQNSLLLVAKKENSLTAIAYECGYFDQSHFIREFKSFTGTTPSGLDIDNTSAVLASPNK